MELFETSFDGVLSATEIAQNLVLEVARVLDLTLKINMNII